MINTSSSAPRKIVLHPILYVEFSMKLSTNFESDETDQWIWLLINYR